MIGSGTTRRFFTRGAGGVGQDRKGRRVLFFRSAVRSQALTENPATPYTVHIPAAHPGGQSAEADCVRL